MSGAGQPVAATRDFIVLADGERGAVLGPHGDVVWMCAPAWHSGSVFGALLGARGEYRIAPHGRFAWGGNYEPGTLIWRSKWITEDGVVTCREALAFPGDRRRAVLMRRVEAVDCDACLDVTLAPWANYGDAAPRDVRRDQDAWHARTGGLQVRWSGAGEAQFDADSGSWRWQLRLRAGARRDLVLEVADGELPAEQPDPESLWAATADAWARAVPVFENSVDPEQSRHSYAVLRGLTGAAGGTVAAATTGLPEHAETGRDYDYRYVWIRDQCYVGEAVATDGPHPLLESATSFVAARLLADGAHTAPCYTCDGEPVPQPSPLDVAGYPGGGASVGNGASEQFQLDLFGEALLLFAAAARHDRLDADGWRAAGIGAAAIADRWQQPDAGVWELDQKAWTHSRLIAAAGLTAIADA